MPAPAVEIPMDEILDEGIWRRRAADHQDRLRQRVDARKLRRSRGEKHPVSDFLFEYYSHRPARLLEWQPGAFIGLENAVDDFREGYRSDGNVTRLDLVSECERRRSALEFVRRLQEAIVSRPRSFACYGLHEWAMVYREETDRRHSLPLRLGPAEIRAVVEQRPLACSHYDAFRFFTSEARPLNRLRPEPENRLELEQGGCIHANMDLYKWCYKLGRLVPSELIADAFDLAWDARVIDMRASPYDLRAFGLEPIAIESPGGRAEYECEQRHLAQRAEPIRRRLISLCERVLENG